MSALSLGDNVAAYSAWGNDFKFQTYLERQVESIGRKGDILFILSTGGGDIKTKQSINLINAAKKAKKNGLKVISLLGKTGGILANKKYSDKFYVVKSNKTSVIQECHISIIHYICYLIDKEFE